MNRWMFLVGIVGILIHVLVLATLVRLIFFIITNR